MRRWLSGWRVGLIKFANNIFACRWKVRVLCWQWRCAAKLKRTSWEGDWRVTWPFIVQCPTIWQKHNSIRDEWGSWPDKFSFSIYLSLILDWLSRGSVHGKRRKRASGKWGRLEQPMWNVMHSPRKCVPRVRQLSSTLTLERERRIVADQVLTGSMSVCIFQSADILRVRSSKSRAALSSV